MITVAGTVFSITIVALTLASSQFGPRLLRNFVGDTGVQITLGTFTATFLYCIFVLRTVRAVDEGAFIPSIAITAAIALAIASLGVLIYFIHHVSASIQAENLIAKVGAELCASVDKHFPARDAGDAGTQSGKQEFQAQVAVSDGLLVRSSRSGYVQAIRQDSLVEFAQRHNLQMELNCTPGDFILSRAVLLTMWSRHDQAPPKSDVQELCRYFNLGSQRTEEEDVRYGARELAEIAARALSPGINDPYTAMGCVDWICDMLARVAERGLAPGFISDATGIVRIKQRPPGFAALCIAAIEPIISYGLDSAQVAQHTVTALTRVADNIARSEDARALHAELGRIATQARVQLKDEEILQRITASIAHTQQRLSMFSNHAH
jgi:uncharacterized membrane protein